MKKLRHATDFAPLSHTYFYFSWKVAAKLRLEYYFKRGKNNFNLFQESLIFFFCITEYGDKLDRYDFSPGWSVIGRKKVGYYISYSKNKKMKHHIDPSAINVLTFQRLSIGMRSWQSQNSCNFTLCHIFYIVTMSSTHKV